MTRVELLHLRYIYSRLYEEKAQKKKEIESIQKTFDQASPPKGSEAHLAYIRSLGASEGAYKALEEATDQLCELIEAANSDYINWRKDHGPIDKK